LFFEEVFVKSWHKILVSLSDSVYFRIAASPNVSALPVQLSSVLLALAERLTIVPFPVSPRCLYLPLQAAGGPPNPAVAGDTTCGGGSKTVDGSICFHSQFQWTRVVGEQLSGTTPDNAREWDGERVFLVCRGYMHTDLLLAQALRRM